MIYLHQFAIAICALIFLAVVYAIGMCFLSALLGRINEPHSWKSECDEHEDVRYTGNIIPIRREL